MVMPWPVHSYAFQANYNLLSLRYMFVMGCHGVEILCFAIKLDGLTMLGLSVRAGFFVFVFLLHGLLVGLFLHNFTLL